MDKKNDFKDKKILIVDDSKLIQKALFQVAQNSNFKDIIIAGDGEEAIELYKKNRPDIVTMDIRMPKKNGIEATQEIYDYDNNAKIIMITTVDDSKAVRLSMMRGASYYIVKPFKGSDVVEVLYKVLFENFTMKDLILKDKNKQERYKYNSDFSEYTIENEKPVVTEIINKKDLLDNLTSMAEILIELEDSREDPELVKNLKERAAYIKNNLNNENVIFKIDELLKKIADMESGLLWFSDGFLEECLYILNYAKKGVEEL